MVPLQHSGGFPVGYIKGGIHGQVIKFRSYTKGGMVVGFCGVFVGVYIEMLVKHWN